MDHKKGSNTAICPGVPGERDERKKLPGEHGSSPNSPFAAAAHHNSPARPSA
jgi:hypothetical protein